MAKNKRPPANSPPHPLNEALAAQAAYARGDELNARRLLRAAIQNFDAGLAAAQSRDREETAVIRQGELIKQTAGRLCNDELVLELHDRWPGRESPAGAFYAGIAAFNLQRFAEVREWWERLPQPEGNIAINAIMTGAFVLGGTVPPFKLEYVEPRTLRQARDVNQAGSIGPGWGKALKFSYGVDLNHPRAQDTMIALVRDTGDWGRQLAENIMQDDDSVMRHKFSAAIGLMHAGVLQPDKPVKVRHRGRIELVQPRRFEVRPLDAKTRPLATKAKSLYAAGKLDDVIALLQPMETLDGPLYPDLLYYLAVAYGESDRFDEAAALFRLMALATPGDPNIPFNLAITLLRKGDFDGCAEALESLNVDLHPHMQQRVSDMQEVLAYRSGNTYINYRAEAKREREDRKPLRLTVRVRTALRSLPVGWLNAIAFGYGEHEHRFRREREEALVTAMLDPARVAEAVIVAAREGSAGDTDYIATALQQMQHGLQHLLNHGGWCRLHDWTDEHGTQDGDGYDWENDPPVSPLGRWRMVGLVHVGMAKVDGFMRQVIVIPADVRQVAAEVLARWGS